MNISRRGMMLGGVNAAMLFVAAGCQESLKTAGYPGVPWDGGGTGGGGLIRSGGYRPTGSSGGVATAGGGGGSVSTVTAVPGLNVIPRSAWTSGGIGGSANPMGRVSRLTIHHAGLGTPTTDRDRASSIRMLTSIRNGHVGNGWADIGYHYVIDVAGNVWEGRPVRYQGAHVRNNNENNVGVMVMGNFDLQRPSSEQLSSLQRTLAALKRHYGVSTGAIKSHQEINPTRCPGKSLQSAFASMRSGGSFG